MTAEEKPDQQHRRPKGKWLKRLGFIFLGLLLIFTIFHRTVLISLIRFGAVKAAATQHLDLKFDLEGSPLSDLTFTNIRILPTDRSPIESINVEKARVTYSIGDLIRHGSTDFVKNCVVKNATLIFKDNPGKPGGPGKKSHLGEDMHHWFFPPVYLIGSASVENLNIIARDPDGDFVLKSGDVHFDRHGPGSVRIAQMQIQHLKTWKNIEATVSMHGNDLVVENGKLTPDITVTKVISSPAVKNGSVSSLTVQGNVFGGQISGEFINTERNGRFDVDVRISASKAGLDGLRKFFDSQVPLEGEIDQVDIQGGGDPDSPPSWHGIATASTISPAGVGEFKLEHANAKLVLANGIATLESSEFSGEVNKAIGDAHGQLPDKLAGFRDMAIDGRFQISAPDLSKSISALTHGSILSEGHFSLRNHEFTSELVATGKDINSEKFDAGLVDAKFTVTKSLAKKQPGSDFPTNTEGHVTAQFKDLRGGKYALDSGTVTMDAKGGWLRLNATDLARGKNTATLHGAYHLPGDATKWAETDFNFDFSLSAPNAASFNAEPDLNGLNGQLEASGNISHSNNLYEGKINIGGTNLSFSDFTASSLNTGIIIEKSVADIQTFSLVMDAKNQVNCTGKIGLEKPFDYTGNIHAAMSDLGVFNPILDAAGLKEKIGGAMTVNWEGSGQFSDIHHTGSGEIKLISGKYGNFQPITAEIAGKYSPENADIPTIHVHVDKTDFVAAIDLHNTEIKIHDILLQQEKVKLLQGGITLPLDLRTPTDPDSLIPSTGRIFANLSSDEINLETLLIQPKKTSPLKGTVKFSVNADGTLDNLIADILVRGRNLQSKAVPAIAPANLELDCDFRDNRFALNGTLQQPAISPLQINGTLPFSLKQFLRDKKLDEQSPINLSVKLSKSPVTIIGQLAPDLRYIEGQMEIDAKATGTIAKPALSGAVTLDMPAIRMKDPDAPAVNAFKASAEFSGNQLTIHNFGGNISGGPFDLTGKILFEKLFAPVLDLRLTSQNALLVRNETVTVRADSDIRIAGVLNAAHVSGTIGITKSKFFREVEILPIELPGKPAPKPPTESQMGFSLKPPFSNWTFDVAIKTKDPFLIRGNLTNGAARIDLKLVGTGAVPSLDGTVRVENFVASLPFSRLNIDYGYVYFTPENPFLPTLDIQGSSSLRDYNIRVYISGTPTDPVTVFTSEPPLPQEEIIALLGTGATAEELTGRSDVLAGRAAVLVFQKIYRKIFKQKQAPDNDSFITRFELDPGTVDPRTGRQEVSARFKISDRFYLIGDLDQEGGVRGQIRYLFRFK
ncbi:MAG: translocation/assembly module TamB domain-containing protein [Chthoniobacteraceae bacterium]